MNEHKRVLFFIVQSLSTMTAPSSFLLLRPLQRAVVIAVMGWALGGQAQTVIAPSAVTGTVSSPGGAAVMSAIPAPGVTGAMAPANPSARPASAVEAAPSAESANATTKTGNAADAGKEATPPKSEAIKDVTADQTETEFQRFVFESTGRRLPLFGYKLFAQPERYAPVLAAPVPGSYVLGPGDELLLQTYGLVDVAERLVIDRNGRVSIPKVGPLKLAGVPYAEAEKLLNAHIGKVYANYTLSLTMARLRSIEVFVLGQAAKPGKHVVSGLSTLINALFETGGASANGSLRQVELRRGGRVIATVDLYQFLSRGDNSTDTPLQSGDVIYIPPAGERAALLGTLNAPAIYELKKGESIADMLALSGGLPVLAAPQKAQLERVDAKAEIARSVEDFALDEAGLKRKLKAGDVLTVFQVSPQIANVVTLEGNVAAPMRYTFTPGMRVSDILGDPRLLIPPTYWLGVNRGANSAAPNRPEVNLDYATIQRLDPKGLTTRLLAFAPAKAMAGDPRENIELKSGDIVTVYGPTQAGPETDDSISLKGEMLGGVRRFPWREGMTLKDLIPSTQWLIDYYQYWQKSSGQNLRNDINWDYAQVTRRIPETLLTESFEFNLGQQVMRDSKDPAYQPLRLKAGDQVQLFTTAQVQVPAEKRNQFVTVRGEVAVPGVYQIRPGETLPQLLQRAGGVTRNAYLYGSIFTRESTRLQQQANIETATRRIEAQLNSQASSVVQNQTEATSAASLQGQLMAQRQLIERLRNLKASGRLALDLDPVEPVLPPLALEDGDSLTVPPVSNFVGAYGAVLAETSFVHKPGKTVAYYLERAGLTRDADVEAVLLIRADGTVQANSAQRNWLGWGNSRFMNTRVEPGDSLFVPELLDRRTPYVQFIQGAKEWTQVLYQFGLGAAAFKTLKN